MRTMEPLSAQTSLPSVSASEPGVVFVLKSLLYPVSTVLTLGLCLLLTSEPLRGAYVLIGVIAFVGTADLLEGLSWHLPQKGAWRRSLAKILPRWLLLVGFIWAILHLCGLNSSVDAGTLMTWALLTPLVLPSVQLSAQRLLVSTGAQQLKPRTAVIVGVTPQGRRLERVLHDYELYRTRVVGYFEDRAPERTPLPGMSPVLGRVADLRDYVSKHRIDIVYITLPMTRQQRIIELLNSLQDSTASIYFVPDLSICEVVQPRFDSLNGIPVVAVCESPFYGLRGAAKRLTDIAIASIGIVLAAPLLLFVAVGVKLSSPGPIIFKQKRYGLDGEEIIVYKFRSMSVTEDGIGTYTQVRRNDERVTRFGRFIRATSLDELPQLFNVLEGSMSIVGPRPHAIAVNEQYRRLIPGYMIRHKVKPGITGWAQVNGYRGGDDIASMTKRIEFDLDYLRHWSLRLDFLIILRTLAIVWKDRHAY
jgi:putative colanic acid biosynthesis UDP-glucose lipid carrier transferase